MGWSRRIRRKNSHFFEIMLHRKETFYQQKKKQLLQISIDCVFPHEVTKKNIIKKKQKKKKKVTGRQSKKEAFCVKKFLDSSCAISSALNCSKLFFFFFWLLFSIYAREDDGYGACNSFRLPLRGKWERCYRPIQTRCLGAGRAARR